jgi:ABC-2 type transport system ATP-binding protein
MTNITSTATNDTTSTPPPSTAVSTSKPSVIAPSTAAGYDLVVEHVTKRYGGDTVVDDLSFVVPPGRVTGFLGPNGSGKSTTMKIMLDLAAASHGRASIGGRRYRELPDPVRTVGAIIESDAFHPGRSGRNHLRILADAAGLPRSRADEMLERVGLTKAAHRRVGAYSLGMRQRLGLAAALLGDPAVLILDEPGNGLDPQGIRELRDLLRHHAAAGGTVFVSSHLLSEVEHLADDVIVINQGRLVTQGSLDELQQRACVVRCAEPATLLTELERAGATVFPRGADGLVVQGMAIDEIGDRAFAAGVAVHELAPQAGSLEELFLSWTGPHSPGGQSGDENSATGYSTGHSSDGNATTEEVMSQ